MKLTLRLVFASAFLLPTMVFAASSAPSAGGATSTKFEDYGGMMETICNTLPFCDRGACLFADIARAVADAALPLVGLAAVASIAYGGVKMIMAGDESGVTEAKKIILTACIGAMIALTAGGIAAYFYYKIVPGATGGSGSTPGPC